MPGIPPPYTAVPRSVLGVPFGRGVHRFRSRLPVAPLSFKVATLVLFVFWWSPAAVVV